MHNMATPSLPWFSFLVFSTCHQKVQPPSQPVAKWEPQERALSLGSCFPLVPAQRSSRGHRVKQHMHRLGPHAGGPAWDPWDALGRLSAVSRLATPRNASSSLSVITRHSGFGNNAIFYQQFHTFFPRYSADFTRGSLSLRSSPPWDIISPETNIPSLTLDYFSSQKLPELTKSG